MTERSFRTDCNPPAHYVSSAAVAHRLGISQQALHRRVHAQIWPIPDYRHRSKGWFWAPERVERAIQGAALAQLDRPPNGGKASAYSGPVGVPRLPVEFDRLVRKRRQAAGWWWGGLA